MAAVQVTSAYIVENIWVFLISFCFFVQNFRRNKFIFTNSKPGGQYIVGVNT